MNNLNVNMKNHTIEMTKKFAAAASKFGTEEYKILQEVRRDYPSYKVVTMIRKVSKSDSCSFKGLTYEYMEKYIVEHDDEEHKIMQEYQYMRDYIKTHGTKEEKKQNLADFEEMILISKCHGKSFRYPVIKKWFLDNYPEIRDFGMPEEASEEESAEEAVPADNVVNIDAAQPSAEELSLGA